MNEIEPDSFVQNNSLPEFNLIDAIIKKYMKLKSVETSDKIDSIDIKLKNKPSNLFLKKKIIFPIRSFIYKINTYRYKFYSESNEKASPKIYQIISTLTYGDSIYNYAKILHDLLIKEGFDAYILTRKIDSRLQNSRYKLLNRQKINEKDVVIYHKTIGDKTTYKFCNLFCRRKIIIYHNITPENFFENFRLNSYFSCKWGRKQLYRLAEKTDDCYTVSEFNKSDLKKYGFTNIKILPMLVDYVAYGSQTAKKDIIDQFKDGKTNIIFVGRVIPSKKQEDIIKSFYYYKKYIDPTARLFIVGRNNRISAYIDMLSQLVKDLKLDDVYFTGHVSFDELLAYYKIADLFLCMSEHEGFGIPILESMYFNIPIVSYNSSALPETIGNGGIVVKNKNFRKIAELINIVLTDRKIKSKIIEEQQKIINHSKDVRRYNEFFKHLKQFI